MSLDTIDFAELYKKHYLATRGRPRPPQVWDERADAIRPRTDVSGYAQDFIARMDFDDARTLLDVGCGAGTLALAVAGRLDRVIALDYSSGMLRALEDGARMQGVRNVQPMLRAWEDDWSDVPVCDLAVASRSTMVPDMAAALAKLHAHARLRVYLTHVADGHFLDPAIQQATGRVRPPGPGCLYILNILRGMGIYPRLDYIAVPGALQGAADFDDYARRVARSMGGLDDAERQRLRVWYDAATPAERAGAPLRWAFIWWDTRDRGGA